MGLESLAIGMIAAGVGAGAAGMSRGGKSGGASAFEKERKAELERERRREEARLRKMQGRSSTLISGGQGLGASGTVTAKTAGLKRKLGE